MSKSKTVTALFADIKGSTELEQDLDPEEARAIIDPTLKLMIDAVERYDGYVVQSTGDGIFALFGAPVAHEDHPQRALHAAMKMLDDVRRYADKLRSEGHAPLQIRIGANTGEVVVRSIATGAGKTEYTPIGHTTNLASRMQTLANPGSTVISESTRKLVEGYFVLKPLGSSRVKGIAESVSVYEVTGLGPLRTRLQRAAARGYTNFVGREREMETLKHVAELARTGHGQIVAVVAEPGAGKSRLLFEFKATSQSGWLVLEAPWFPHSKATAYQPLIDLLLGYFEIADEDDARRRRQKLSGKLLDLDRSLEDALPYLFALLGIAEGEDSLAQMDPQIRRRRTQEAVKRTLLRESLNQPLMLIFEDLHWIDEETQAFLNLLAEGIANAPMLLLVNYRPDYSHTWGSKTYYTQLRLDPLAKESAAEMLSARVGYSPELARLKQLVIERTEGNPLFMEELVEALFDEGVLVRNGTVKLVRPLGQLKLPPTVQAILAARIDRMPLEAKELLQKLAVIGMEFPLSLVCKVVQEPPNQVDDLLSDLQRGEFIYEQPVAADVQYRFKHALTHQAAYDALLTERRRWLHERTAEAIEVLYSERLEDHYADLAHHYRLSNNTAKAVEYLRLAGKQAGGRGAYAQALANVEPALRLIEQLPEEAERLRAELGVRLMEGMAVSTVYGMDSAERLRTFQRVRELSEKLGDESAEIHGRINIAGAYLSAGADISLALEMVRPCLDLAERAPGGGLRPVVNLQRASLLHNSGDPVQASSLLGNLMTHFEPALQEAGSDFLPINSWILTPLIFSLVQQTLGRTDEALKLSKQALLRARELKRPFTLSAACGIAARFHWQLREPEAARQMAEAAVAVAEEYGFRNWINIGRSVRGRVLVENGQVEDGVAELEANAPFVAPGLHKNFVSAILAEAYLRSRSPDRALCTLNDALANCERSGTHVDEPDLHRLKGEALLMGDPSATAEAWACFQEAIEVARRQSAKWWELRATMSLARLLAKEGHRDKAHTMLGDVYGWFTEGFATADLKDAKALLEELNA